MVASRQSSSSPSQRVIASRPCSDAPIVDANLPQRQQGEQRRSCRSCATNDQPATRRAGILRAIAYGACPMKTYFADTAWLPHGWSVNVRMDVAQGTLRMVAEDAD